MTLSELNRQLSDTLAATLGEREARAVARLVMEDVVGASQIDILVRGDRPLEPETVAKASRIAERIAAGEPAQYVVGRARFMGLDFAVTPATLIPRPETEGLVDLIVDDYRGRSGLHILDVGTGSGCIAISLARALPFSEIEAWDISDAALDVAGANARNLNVKIDFRRADALAAQVEEPHTLDIVVSNPPYIAESERASMDARVLDFEPETALFVPDNDPLRFYNAIATYAADALVDGGRIYFEINPLFADQLADRLHRIGFTEVEILRDYIGRKRFARALWRL